MKDIKIVSFILFFTLLFLGCNTEGSADYANENSTTTQKQKEVLLIGTFHYNNPGADVAKTKSFDILKEESQKELETIADKIAAFRPTKIFVEWDYDEQVELDSLYQLYQHDKYFANKDLNDFYRKNEIFQLAFRVARKGRVAQVQGIDYRTDFPFDSLMTILENNQQVEIQSRLGEMIDTFTTGFDNRIKDGESLLNLTYYLNTSALREMSNEFHNQIPLMAGPKDNFIGPFLTSEWYRRNLYMWSLIQKGVENDDERIMVLVGASHAAILKNFIDENKSWEVVELEAVIDD